MTTTANAGPAKDTYERAVVRWWQSLKDRPGDRATLRRCHEPIEVVFAPPYHRLWRGLPPEDRRVSRERLAALAGVLSWVDTDTPTVPFAEHLAKLRGSSPSAQSRFRRLMVVTTADELQQQVTRVVRLCGGSANIADLALSFRYWGDSIKKDWAFSFYAHADAEH